MNNVYRSVCLSLAVILVGVVCHGTAQAGEVRDYFVAPITTELQRDSISSTADTYACVNCNAFIVDGKWAATEFDEEGFLKALGDVDSKKESLHLSCRYAFSDEPIEDEEALHKKINAHLKKLANSVGFDAVRTVESQTSAAWADAVGHVETLDQLNDADENLIENDYVRLFPVRTRLSWFDNGEVDCVVEILRPIDGRTEGLSKELKSAITDAVRAATLTQKRKILFSVTSTEAGYEKIETLFNAIPPPEPPKSNDQAMQDFYKARRKAYTPSPAFELARELGFDRITFRHSPCGGAPETLLGQPVPNFQLEQLKGGELDLREFLDGRPGLITFWGLACGPCRKEASHLSELHEQLGDQVAIVAVNAYDDDRESVEKYVKNDGLTHPIVLDGSAICEDAYHVQAYPTTFWVDTTGTVVDYEIGFASRKNLERRVRDLIEK